MARAGRLAVVAALAALVTAPLTSTSGAFPCGPEQEPICTVIVIACRPVDKVVPPPANSFCHLM